MATVPVPAVRNALKVELIATFPNFRALAWDGDRLYGSRGYDLCSASMTASRLEWQRVASYSAEWWRRVSSRFPLSYRLLRDGFHALAILPSGNLIAAVPGAIVTLPFRRTEFQISHSIRRGTRPLHIATAPDGRVFWGEYFDNPERSEVHIFASCDGGLTWEIAHTFGKGSVRHVHNIAYDRWGNCFWILTGDYGTECKIIRASMGLESWDEVISGSQQTRAVAAVVTQEGLYFASDTPLEQNYIYLLDRGARIHRLSRIPSSSIYGGRNSNGIFFSTMVEPSEVNRTKNVALSGSIDGSLWQPIVDWRKDRWSMRFFQYGNAFLPDGVNTTDLLAATTIAVEGADLQTTIWRTAAG